MHDQMWFTLILTTPHNPLICDYTLRLVYQLVNMLCCEGVYMTCALYNLPFTIIGSVLTSQDELRGVINHLLQLM